MDPRSLNNKKREQFKKEIRNEQIQRKRDSIRRGLPYYEPMFRKSDEDSNGTNSRSSRFPVPEKRSKQQINERGQNQGTIYEKENFWSSEKEAEQEKKKQMRYIEYLRNLKDEDREERKNMINSEMIKHYGETCFEFMDELRDQIHIDLQNFERKIMDENCEEFLRDFGWSFVLATFYLAENENYIEIQSLSFSLLTNYFMKWFQAYAVQEISQNSSIKDLLDNFVQVEEDKQKIEEVIFSQYLSAKDEGYIDEVTLDIIVAYFSQKLDIFLELEKTIESAYSNEEYEFFSELMFDFGSLYLVESLLEILIHKETTYDLKINIFVLLNKYHSAYPINVLSSTETDQKFIEFISIYLKKLQKFLKVSMKRIENIPIISTQFELMESSLKLLRCLYWRESDDQGILFIVMETYQKVVDATLKMQLTKEMAQFVEFHGEMLDFFLLVYGSAKSIEEMFQTNTFISYFNSLLLEWHSFKINQRNQNLGFLESEQDANKFMRFEFYLIECLHMTKQIILSTDQQNFTKQDKEYIESMFQYADFAYINDRNLLFELIKGNKNSILTKEMLLFEENVKLYFHLFREENEQIHNPENFEGQSGQRDVEI